MHHADAASRHGVGSNLVFGSGGSLLGNLRGVIANQNVLATIPQPSLEVTCRGHRSSVTGVSFQRLSRTALTVSRAPVVVDAVAPKVVSSSMDGALTLWDAKVTHRSLRNTAHHSPVLCCDCSPKALAVASGGHNGYAQLWVPNLRRTSSTYPATWSFPAANGNEDDHYQWKAHSGATRAIAFSQDGSDYVYTAGDDKAIKCWDLNYLQATSYHPGGGRQRGSGNRFVGSFSSPSTGALTGIAGHTNWIQCLAVQGPDTHSSYFHLLASGGDDRCAFLWDTRTHRCVDVLREPSDSVRSLSFHPTGYALACSDADGAIQIYDLRRVKGPLATLSNPAAAPSHRHTTASPLTRSSHVMLQRYPTAHTGAANGVVFTPDGNWLLSVGDDGDIHVWDVLEGHLYCTVQAHTGAVKTISISADGGYFATGGYDHTVLVWRLNLPRASHPTLVRSRRSGMQRESSSSPVALVSSAGRRNMGGEQEEEEQDSYPRVGGQQQRPHETQAYMYATYEDEEEEEEEGMPRRTAPPPPPPPPPPSRSVADDAKRADTLTTAPAPTGTTPPARQPFTADMVITPVSRGEDDEEEKLTRFRRSEERLDYPATPVTSASMPTRVERVSEEIPTPVAFSSVPHVTTTTTTTTTARAAPVAWSGGDGLGSLTALTAVPQDGVTHRPLTSATAAYPVEHLDMLFHEQQKIREEMRELRGAVEAMAAKATAISASPATTPDGDAVRQLQEDVQAMQQRQKQEYHELRSLLTAWMGTQEHGVV